MAVVQQEDIQAKERPELPWQPGTNAMKNWSAFAKAIGNFFMEAGVHKGSAGKLFDLTVQKVERLILGGGHKENFAEGGIDEEEPLVALACSAVWVMQVHAPSPQNSPCT